jgi:excinuclease UvrABC ATPase subunit
VLNVSYLTPAHVFSVVEAWVIDLGPEGSDGGGEIVAWAHPEDIVKAPSGYAGRFPKQALAKVESAADW